MSAPASSSRPTAKDQSTTNNEELHKQLWRSCSETQNGFERLWTSEDLRAIKCMEDRSLDELLVCISKLVHECLFRSLSAGDTACWKIFPLALAEKVSKLNQHERIIFYLIEASRSSGIWSKTVKSRAGVPSSSFDKALKVLENKKLVRQFQDAKTSKKLYIMTSLHPSEEAKEDLFYSDGRVDQDLSDNISKVTEMFVHQKAWQSPKPRMNGSRKRKRNQNEDKPDLDILSGPKRYEGVSAWPAGHVGYATLESTTDYLNSIPILHTKKIAQFDVERVLRLLIAEDRIEEVPSGGYRTILRPLSNSYMDFKVTEDAQRNGIGGVPCGGCPNLKICNDTASGISADTCEYFEKWFEE